MKIAVLIPAYNEGNAIYDVVKSYQKEVPDAEVYVYDNNSSDNTSDEAMRAGAIVRKENRQGKGNVVRSMFLDIDADYYLMVDGDGTYDAKRAKDLIQTAQDNLADMVVGTRNDVNQTAHRAGHKFGNDLFNFILKVIFNSPFKDIFSGFRVFSKRFVKTFPAMSNGFDTETDMSIFALYLKLKVIEVKTDFFDRAVGTESKLSTFKDGFKIAFRMFYLFKEYRPMALFSFIAIVLFIIAVLLGIPLVDHYLETSTVARIPTAIICVGLGIFGVVSFLIGLVLDSLSNTKRDLLKTAILRT